MNAILCIDDEQSMRESVSFIFEDRAKVVVAADVSQGRQILKNEKIDLILLDLSLPDVDGLTFLRELSQEYPAIPVLMVTANDTEHTLAEALKHGARGRITKPFDVAELRHHVAQALSASQAPKIKEVLQPYGVGQTIIAESLIYSKAINRAIELSKGTSPIVLVGERGTGKEFVARHIHSTNFGSLDVFYAVQCSRSEAILAGQLFGEDGRAGILQTMTGYIYFDGADRLPLSIKERLGEVIATRKSANAPLLIFGVCDLSLFLKGAPAELSKIAEERSVRLPSLKEREEDIPFLAHCFLTEASRQHGNKLIAFQPEALRMLREYSWPGNIRELQNVIERLVLIHGEEEEVQSSHLPREICPIPSRIPRIPGLSLEQAVENFEKGILLHTLEQTAWNATKAADMLSITHRKMALRVQAMNLRNKGEEKTDEVRTGG